MKKGTIYRRLIILPVVACLLSGCHAQSSPEGSDGGRVPVLFAPERAAGTKASSDAILSRTRTYIPSGTDFGIFGWYGTPSGAPDYMYNELIHNEGGSLEGSFSYSPPKYWPSDGAPLSFVAYWPYGCEGLTLSDAGSPMSLRYSTPVSASSQPDLLVSGPVSGTVEDRVLRLPFRHALSMVTFDVVADPSFAANRSAVVIHSLTLKGACTDGVWTPVGGWSSREGSADFVVGPHGEDDDVLLLIPQPTGGLSVEADFTVHMLDGEGVSVSSSRHCLEAAVPPVDGAGEWEAGECYAYHITVRETHLELTVSIAPWTVRESTFNYSTEISVAGGGTLAWKAGTYSSLSTSTFNIITRFDTDLEASFEIETPEGAVWYAILETRSGDSDAFAFVDADGNLSSSAHGLVGERATIRIRQRNPYPSETNRATLSFVVRSGGRNIPVTSLVDNYNHNWTIVQNANN